MLSGYLMSVFNLLSTLLSVTWVPLFILVFFAAIKKNNLKYAVLSGVVGTFMFLGGGVEICYLTFGVSFILVLFPELIWYKEPLPDLKRRLILFLTFCLVFFGLAAVQLLPFLELSQLSVRSVGLSYKEASTWSLHPYDLLELFLPDQYGLATDIKEYWAYQSWLKSIYMGGIPFILGYFFFKNWDRKAQGILLFIFISLGLAMGNNTLFHHFLYDYLPLFNKLRYPVKFIFLAVLLISIAAGLGCDYFKNHFKENNQTSKVGAPNLLILGFWGMIVFGLLNIFNEPLIVYFKQIGWDKPVYNEVELNVFNFKRFLGFSSLFCLVLFLYSRSNSKNLIIRFMMVALLTLDLFFAHYDFFLKGDYKIINQPGKISKFLKSDPELFRIYVTPQTRNIKLDKKEEAKKLNLVKEQLALGLLDNQRLLDINVFEVTILKNWDNVIDLINSAPEVDSTNLLNLVNVKYVISLPVINSSDFELIYSGNPEILNSEENQEEEIPKVIKVYENKKVLPHAFLVSQCKLVGSEFEYKEILQSKHFYTEELVLLDKEPKGFSCGNPVIQNKKGFIKIDSYRSNVVKISTETQSRQFLFLSDSYYPGWKAYVDGDEVEILRGNYAFRTILIEPGKHKVSFKYDPMSFKIGLAITLATILFCFIYFIKIKSIRKLESNNSQPA